MIKKNKKEKIKTTYDKFIESLTPNEQEEFEEEYRDFLISEMLLAAMQEDNLSVRELAKLAGVSPTIVQGIRSGEKQNVTLNSL